MIQPNSFATRRRFLGSSIGSIAGVSAVSRGAQAAETPQPKPFVSQATIDLSLPAARRIVMDHEQHLLVAVGKQVQRWSPEGRLVSDMVFERPVRCLATRGKQTLVGIRDSVRVMDQAGRLQHWLPTIGAGHLVGDVLVEGDSILVVDITAGSLQRFGGDGRWQVVASRKTGFRLPAGGRVIQTPSGQWVVTHPGRHRVDCLDSRGRVNSSWGHRSRDETGFQGCCNPLAIAALDDGTVVTAEAGQLRLKQFDAAGQFIQQIAGPERFEILATGDRPPSDRSAKELSCAVGGIDLALDDDGMLWLLHAAARQVVAWRPIERA